MVETIRSLATGDSGLVIGSGHDADEPTKGGLPLTALVAEDPSAPVVLFVDSAALRMAVVERAVAPMVPSDWDVSGVYVLLDVVEADKSRGCYVGKAPMGLRTCLQQRLKDRHDQWYRAVLICRRS